MKKARILRATSSVIAFCAIHSSVMAGGLERSGYNIDLLFDPSSVAVESTNVYVAPQRKLRDARDVNASNGLGSDGLGGGATSAEGAEGFWAPRVGVKFSIGDSADCMADYSQPWGAHTAPGRNWVGAGSDIETEIDSHAYAATCSYRFDASQGQLRAIGGVVYQEVSGFKESLVAPAGFPGVVGTGVGRLEVDGSGWGWRAGLAYELPEYAFRANLIYNSEVNLDNLSGTLNLRQVNGGSLGIFGAQALPQSVEAKVQTGIAPDWLAFGSVKWTDWSIVQSVPFFIQGTSIVATSLDLGYRDGVTITGGVGHKFNDRWNGAASLTWDRGTSQGFGTQTDSWTLGAGVGYSPTDKIELRFGTALSLLTAGESKATMIDGVNYGTETTYRVGTDLAASVFSSVKVKF